MKSKRGAVAVLVVALWIGGMAMMAHRNANRTESQQLAEVALRVQPATFYYTIDRDGEQIGAASSALDTTAKSLLSEEYFVGDFSAAATPAERTSARWQTRLTRGLHMIDLSADVARPTRPFSINATVQEDTSIFIAGKKKTGRPAARYTFTAPLFNPTVASVVFMLGAPPKIGRTQTISVFDPMTRTVVRPTLRIRAESLFAVVDSAARDRSGEWTVAHRDTVRAWRIEGAPHGLDAWVDADGRLVAARAGSYSAIRTAFEIAFRNSKAK
ncbi:MAG: hypothetical protein JWL97_1772 [Gemmatimonadales bacterium]|nr:hypothetical protein [Gemmatimonadales bacterium]